MRAAPERPTAVYTARLMLAVTADHVVVLADDRVLAVLNAVSARLSAISLRALDAQVESPGDDPRLVAESWLRARGVASVGEASH